MTNKQTSYNSIIHSRIC